MRLLLSFLFFVLTIQVVSASTDYSDDSFTLELNSDYEFEPAHNLYIDEIERSVSPKVFFSPGCIMLGWWAAGNAIQNGSSAGEAQMIAFAVTWACNFMGG